MSAVPPRVALDRASALRSAIAELIIVFESYNPYLLIFYKFLLQPKINA